MTDTRHVLVTGANSGIGLAATLELARRGFRVTGTVRSPDKADVLQLAAAEADVAVESRILEVTDAAGCADLVADLGPLYGLVNNAGYGLTGAVEDVPDDEAREALETMVVAPMRLSRLVIPGMREAGGGRIVNISSIYGRATTPMSGWYQATKHALEALSDALRMEVAADRIHVVLVEPGGFKTNIWEHVQRDLAKREGTRYENAYERAGGLMEMFEGLMGEPETCAKVIARALQARSPRARYLVGTDARLIAAASQITPTPVMDRIMRFGQGL